LKRARPRGGSGMLSEALSRQPDGLAKGVQVRHGGGMKNAPDPHHRQHFPAGSSKDWVLPHFAWFYIKVSGNLAGTRMSKPEVCDETTIKPMQDIRVYSSLPRKMRKNPIF
jgi:hypothetical protein